MADFTRNLDAFDPNWLKQLAHSPIGADFSDFLINEAHSRDSFCPSCLRFPSTASADDHHLARHLSALSLLRNRCPALNLTTPPPPAGLYLERLKTAATVRENNSNAASAYPRLPRVSASPSPSPSPRPPPLPSSEQRLRPRKVVNGLAASRLDTLYEVHNRKANQVGGYPSSSKGKYPAEPTRAGRSAGGVVVPLQKQRSRPTQTRVYPFQGSGSGLPRAGDLGSRNSSAGSGTGVFIPLAPPDSAAAADYLRSKLLISGKQRRDPRHVGRRAAAAAAAGGGAEVSGRKYALSMEEGGGRSSSSVDQKGEEEECHYHLPAEWTY
ncbi:unnamed protein product [Linum trigynum]|uniref:Uncharacterized protein n=1 Tax=Linum trigynum TaxID=586398 RepID=A0AAV2CXX8_9ROSI